MSPWLTEDAIKFLEGYLSKEITMLEFGSGKSTVWFFDRVKSIISIEHNQTWYDWVKEQRPQADVRLLQPPQYYEICNQFPTEYFDLIVIDGKNDTRVKCAENSIRILKRGGILLLDNAERAFYRPVINRSVDDSKILDLTDGWELHFTNERPVSQHGNWYTVWWEKPS